MGCHFAAVCEVVSRPDCSQSGRLRQSSRLWWISAAVAPRRSCYLCLCMKSGRSVTSGLLSQNNPFDLVERDLVIAAIVKFGRARALVRGHLLRVLDEEYAAVLARSKFAFPPDEIAAVLTMFRSQGELFRPDVSAAVSSDPADTKFLH